MTEPHVQSYRRVVKGREDQIVAHREHPHAWLWEPLERDPGFELRAMFGAKAVYLDGKLMLCFIAKVEPWCGVLVCTDVERQPGLREQFKSIVPHPVLPKWLYLSEGCDAFERVARELVQLAAGRDPRIGVVPKPKPARSKSTRKASTGRPRKRE